MAKCILACATAALLAAGCGGTIRHTGDDDGTTDSGVDVTTDSTVDVPGEPSGDPSGETADDPVEDVVTETMPDGPDPGCDTDLGILGTSDNWAGIAGGDYWLVAAPTVGDWSLPITEIMVESWGAYGGPMSTGTYTISSWEDYETCTMCIWIFEDCSDYGSGCAHYYMADTARLDILTIDPSRGGDIEGTLSDAYLIEVTEDGMTVIEDGLSYCLDVWAFDETFERMGG